MKLLNVEIECQGRGDRVEIFPLYDMHIGKSNCNELAIRKWIGEVVKRDRMPNRHIRVLLGGDAANAVKPKDTKRFDFTDVADWLLEGDKEEVRDKLSDVASHEVKRITKILDPVKHILLGAIEGNHEKAIRKWYNQDIQKMLCDNLGVPNLSDEVLIRFRFIRNSGKSSSSVIVVARHGYGAGRSVSAEHLKLYAMQAEWEIADICISGHTHTFAYSAPKPVAYVPTRGDLPADLLWRHRFALNPGCWLDSHSVGRGTYESNNCYPARAFMTAKIVIWPFYEQVIGGREYISPKIEIRSYPIL
uniref:Putative DNA repair exonuclease n=1 Tax=viral metagenome TaxID=1070528 RepID=A0A6M3J8S4_9ZZZZ